MRKEEKRKKFKYQYDWLYLLAAWLHPRADWFQRLVDEASPPADEASPPVNDASPFGPYIFTKLVPSFLMSISFLCFYAQKR